MGWVLATPVLPTISRSIHPAVLPQELGKWRRRERERCVKREKKEMKEGMQMAIDAFCSLSIRENKELSNELVCCCS